MVIIRQVRLRGKQRETAGDDTFFLPTTKYLAKNGYD